MSYIEQIDKTRIPQHVAIIMDGNGRWAKQRGEERTYGHRAGAETVQNITEDAARLGIKYLTLYTFSTENWNRPQDEIAALMNLLLESIEEETLMMVRELMSFLPSNNIKKLVSGIGLLTVLLLARVGIASLREFFLLQQSKDLALC